jgi:hydroxymethylpyrimidine pyrophosphatase-like HAD family hydrolase
MLEASAIGVAVGNACSAAKAASDIILPLECSEGGVAMALDDVLGL